MRKQKKSLNIAIFVTPKSKIMISNDIYKAAHLLYNDEVVAIPTETVYGLAGNVFSERAINKIFELKNRPHTNPLIVHIGSKDQIYELASEVPELAKRLTDKFWPGPLTLVLKKNKNVPDLVTGGKDTIAVRMPNHTATLKLLSLLTFPLAAPSANPFGSISPTSASHVYNYFKGLLPMVLEGGICKDGIESTIIGFEDEKPVIYRLGSTTIEAIQNEIGVVKIKNFSKANPEAPGMMAKHYAPKTRTVLTQNLNDTINFYEGKKIGLLLFNSIIPNKQIIHQEVLSSSGNLKEAAYNLYAALHRLDGLELDIIIAQKFPDSDFGIAINDRLNRAAESENLLYTF